MKNLDAINIKYFKYACNEIGKESPNDIAAKCVICGDSKTKNKKRLHLYTKENVDSDLIHCFNCGYSGNMYSFLKEVNMSLYNQYVQEKKTESFKNIKEKTKKQNNFTDKIYYTQKNSLELFDKPQEFEKMTNKGYEYLKSRKLEIFSHLFYFSNTDIKINEKIHPTKNCIIIPLKKGDKWYGFQARSIKSKFFHTFIPENNSGYKIWNWFNIDKSKPTFIFESVFDALSSGLPLQNITAALGASFPEEKLNELYKPIFCLDNHNIDDAAKRQLLIYVENYDIFVWNKDIKEKDFNQLLNSDTMNRNDIAKMILKNIGKGLKQKIKLLIN